jgi:hypothetical protein
MKYSVIFLIDDESEEFSGFFDTIYGLFERLGEDFEVVVVANGTERYVGAGLNSRKNQTENLKIVAFQKKVPQPVCLKTALNQCSGNLILSLGSFQELSSSSYDRLVDSMTDGVDLVVPYRKARKDPWLNRFHSRMLNRSVRWMLGVKVNDIGCNARLCRREVLERLDLYGNMFTYLPALAMQKGFRVKEIECEQFETGGKAKLYGLGQYVNRFSDLASLFFGAHFSRKPLRFFNLVGAGFAALGVTILTYVGVQRAILNVPIGERLLLVIGMICLVGGVQLASFGLLGEIIAFVHGRSRREYTIEKII